MKLPVSKPLNLSQLTEEMKAVVPALEGVDQDGAVLTMRRLTGNFTPQEQALLATALAAHVINPPANPDQELDLAIQNATTLQELKDALLGKTRPGKIKGQKP